MNYKSYYENQCGSGLPVFHGSKYQRGYGLGNMFRSFFRWIAPVIKTHAVPVLKEGAQTVGSEAIRTLANVANDTLSGEKLSESFRNRSKDAINSLANRAEARLQSGKCYKKRRKSKIRHCVKTNRRKRKAKKNHKKRKIKRRRTRTDVFETL